MLSALLNKTSLPSVYEKMHIKDPLLLLGKSSQCGNSMFPYLVTCKPHLCGNTMDSRLPGLKICMEGRWKKCFIYSWSTFYLWYTDIEHLANATQIMSYVYYPIDRKIHTMAMYYINHGTVVCVPFRAGKINNNK